MERNPATEAVAMMEPEGHDLEDEVRRMARDACLVARNMLMSAQKAESISTCRRILE